MEGVEQIVRPRKDYLGDIMTRIANWKIWIRLTAAIWLVLVIAWGGLIAWVLIWHN